MKKSAATLTIAACVGLCALVWAHGTKSENVPIPAQLPAVSASLPAVAQGGNSVFDGKESSEAYTPAPPIEVPERKAVNGTEQQESTHTSAPHTEATAPMAAPPHNCTHPLHLW